MKSAYKILLISAAISFAIAMLITLGFDSNTPADFLGFFGLMVILSAFGNLFIALISVILQKKAAAKNFLLSGGILLLIGFAVCSVTFVIM